MSEEQNKKGIAFCIHDIKEANGKTIKENNLEKKHKIAIGSLVEVKYKRWHGEGACEIVYARLWVHSHDRDCDGTPLYSLSPNYYTIYSGAKIHFDGRILRDSIAKKILGDIRSGFPEECLKEIRVTEELKRGYGSLEWGKIHMII
jgi:hypothetical protein